MSKFVKTKINQIIYVIIIPLVINYIISCLLFKFVYPFTNKWVKEKGFRKSIYVHVVDLYITGQYFASFFLFWHVYERFVWMRYKRGVLYYYRHIWEYKGSKFIIVYFVLILFLFFIYMFLLEFLVHF